MTDTTTTNASNANPAMDGDLQPAARAYLDAVATHLVDLDVAARGELVSDIADALSEQSLDTTFEAIVVALGSPSRFATELRSAAGFPPASPVISANSHGATFGAVMVDRFDAAAIWSGRELEPLWWIVRGVFAGAVLFIVTRVLGVGGVGDSREGVAAFGLIAVSISVALGIRARVRGAVGEPLTLRNLRLRGATTIIGGALFAVVLANLVSSSGQWGGVYYGGDQAAAVSATGLTLNGSDVSNIYAFDAHGAPVNNVRLYTDDGRPLDVLADSGDPTRQAYSDQTGTNISNVFPLRYHDSATGDVTNPDAGWPASPGALRDASVAVAGSAADVTPPEQPAVPAAPTPAVHPRAAKLAATSARH